MGCVSDKQKKQELHRQSLYQTQHIFVPTTTPETGKVVKTSEQPQKQQIQDVNVNQIQIIDYSQSFVKIIEEVFSFPEPINSRELVQRNRRSKEIFQKYYLKNENLYDKLNYQIQGEQITLAELKDYSNEFKVTFENLLFLSNEFGLTIIEVILEYQEDYEILQDLLMNYKIHDTLIQYLSIPLFNKIKRIKDKQVDQTIKLVKVLDEKKIFELFFSNHSSLYRQEFLVDTFNNMVSQLKTNKKAHLKLIKLFSHIKLKILKNPDLLQEYNIIKRDNIFSQLKVPKQIAQSTEGIAAQNHDLESNILLNHLGINIFHQLALNKEWNKLLACCNSYYFAPDLSEITPFMLIFKYAPFQIVNQFILKYPASLEQGIKYQTKGGQNLIHCFCANKYLSNGADSDCLQVMNQILINDQIESLLNSQYKGQIPLIYYLNIHKKFNQEIIKFLSRFLLKDFNFAKLEIYASLFGEELKQRKKIIKYQALQVKPKEIPKNIKYEGSIQSINISEELLNEFDLFYHHFIELQKLSIKHPQLISYFPHLNQYFIFTSFFPYDMATQDQTFYNIIFRQLPDEKVSQLLNQIDLPKLIQLYKQSVQQFKIDLPKNYSVECQILAKILSIKKDLKNLEHHTFLNEQVISILKINPGLLFNKVYGQCQVKLLNSQSSLYFLILASNDIDLLQQALKLAFEFFAQEQNLDHLNQQIILHHSQFYLKNSSKEKIEGFINKFPLKLNEFPKKFKQFNGAKEIPQLQLDQCQKIFLSLNFRNLDHYLNNPLKLIFSIFSVNQITKLMIVHFKQFINNNIDFFLPRLWACSLGSDDDILTHLNLGQSKRLIIQFLFFHQFQRFFHWQQKGAEFQVINFEKKMERFHFETQLTYIQLFYKLDFFMTLGLDDILNQQLEDYYSVYTKKFEKIQYTKLPLSLMLKNQAFQNINYFIKIFELNKPSLISILVENYFYQSNTFKSDGGEIQQNVKFFNEQILQILQMNIEENYDHQILIPLIKYIQYIEYDVFIQIDQTLRMQLYVNNSFQNISQLKLFDFQANLKSYFNIQLHSQEECRKIQKNFFLDFIKEVNQEENGKPILEIMSDFLSQALQENEEFSEYILENLTKKDLSFSKEIRFCNIFLHFYQQNNDRFGDYFHKIDVSSNQFFQIYCYALQRNNIQALNILLYYLEKQEYQQSFNQVYNGYFKKQSIECQNYFRALNQKYYIVLTTQQYITFLNQIAIDVDDQNTHLKIFILLGYHEKLLALLFYVNQNLNIDDILLTLIFRKKMYLQQIYKFELPFLDKNLDDRIQNLYKWFQQLTQKELSTYCLFSSKIDSFENYWQDVDHQSTFDIMDSYLQKQNIQNELIEVNQYLSLLLNPKPQTIKQSQLMIDLLIALFSSKKSIHGADFFKVRQESYIELFNSNEQQSDIKFELAKPNANSFKFIENLLVKIVQKERSLKYSLTIEVVKFTQYILQYDFQRVELKELVQEGVKQYEIKNFNRTTLFYYKQNVNLLCQSTYDFSKHRFFQHRYVAIKEITKMNDLNLQLLTPVQILLCKGKLDHLKLQDLKFSNSNLLAALIGNNFESITTIINLHPNPVQLIQQTNIFQTLIQFQNEKNIHHFYNQFLVNKQKDFYKQILINKEQMLYQIIFLNKQQIFENAFFPCMCHLFGEQQAKESLQYEIQKQTVDNITFYQLVFLQKSFFMLEFMDSIVSPDEIEMYFQSITLNVDQTQYSNSSKITKFRAFKDIYEQNRSLLSLKQLKYKFNPFQIFTKKKQQKMKSLVKFQRQDNWRQEILDRTLYLQQACIYKLLGFQHKIYKLLTTNYKFFTLFQKSKSDIHGALKLCKGNIHLLEIYKTSYKIEKNMVKEIFLPCSSFYLLQHPFFYQEILTFPFEFFEILRISDYNLEISLLLALKLQNNQNFQSFLQQQMNNTLNPLNYFQGYERIPEIFLFLMLILNNIFNITFIENLDNISVELLIRTNIFINKTFGKFTSQVNSLEVDFIIKLLKKNIIFKDNQKFMNILNTQTQGLPIIIGLLYVKKIEILIDQFLMKLPEQIHPFINNFLVSFKEDLVFDFENKQCVIPIQFMDEDFQLKEQFNDKILENIKLKLYQQNLEQHKQEFDSFIQSFPLYDLNEIPNQINPYFIPLNFFDQVNEVQQSKIQKKTNLFKYVVKKKYGNNYQRWILTKQKKKEQTDEQQEQVSSDKIKHQKQLISDFQAGILSKMLFFLKLLVPLQNIERNYNLNDLDAPHQLQFQTDDQKENIENNEEKQTLSNIQKLQKQVAFLKDIQPASQILNYKLIKSYTKNSIPVLFEFYHYVFPSSFNIQLMPLTEEEYQEKYNQKSNLQFLTFKFRKYNEAFKQYLTTGQFNYEQTIVLPFYIKEEKIIYEKAHFTPYAFQKIFSKLYSLVQLISKLCQNTELDVEWRFHAISILEVVLKPYSEFLETQKLKYDIITLINTFCRWKTLQLILNSIINHNIKSFPKINAIFKKISVEFIASNDKLTDQVQYPKYQLLDDLFFFGQPIYMLHHQTLIIKLSIGKNKLDDLQNLPQQQPEHQKQQKFYSRLFKNPEESLERYQINIIDETDFLFQIFTPEKLVLFLFKKTKLDSQFQEFSKYLKEIYNKIIVFTANYQDLLNIFVPKIISLLESGERSSYQQRTIKYQLYTVQKYFRKNCFKSFIETITSSDFTQSFFTQLSVLMQSLRQNNSFYLQIQKNERKLVKGHKSKVIERICDFSSNIVLPFYFGFQISLQYFLQISKQSDICLIINKQEDGLRKYAYVKPYQYAGCINNYIKFYDLEAGGEILTLAKVQDQIIITDTKDDKQIKNKYEKATVDINVDEIVSVILFEKFWPMDINYSEIQNVFFTDINGSLIVCHEKKFLSKMNFIQNVENENEKQQILDNFFGPNFIQASVKFSVTQMIPVIPDQIKYKFRLGNQGKADETKDKDMKTQNINLNIFDDYSTLDPLNFCQLNIASFFDENQDIQKHVKKLFKLQSKYKELQKINFFVKFDNNLNFKPIMHLNLFFQNQIIFEEFVEGLEQFLKGQEYSLIENSLSLLFDYPSITSLKLAFINSIIKSVEFYFGQSNQEGSIELKQGNLQVVSNSNGQKIQMLFYSQISNYFFKLILNLQDPSIKQYHLKNSNFEIQISETLQQEDEENLGILLLIINLLYKLIYQQEDKKFQFKLINKEDAERKQQESFYAFNKRNKIIIINFQLFQDFSLSKFLIDYLNDQAHDQIQKNVQPASNLYLFENQIILDKISLQLEDLFKGLEDSEDLEIQLSKNCGPKQVIDDKLEPRQFTNAFLILRNKGYCIDILSIKSTVNYWPLIQFYNQKSGITNFGQIFFFLIYGVDQYSNMNEQLSKIDVLMILKNKQATIPLNKCIKNQKYVIFTPKMITNNILLMQIQTTCIKKVTLTSNQAKLKIKIHKTDLFDSKKVIQFTQQETNKKLTLNHAAVLIEEKKEISFKRIKFQKFLIQNMYSSNEKLWRIVRKGIINSDSQNSSNKNMNHYNIAEILNQNTISLINDDLKNQFTKCGQIRTDIFEYGSNQDQTLVESCRPLFIHSQFQQIKLAPIIHKEPYGIKLQWNPIIKGFYNLYFDDQQIEGNFIVLADDINIEKSEIIFPNPTKQITLYRELTFIVKMRDYYNNIFGDIEYRQSHFDIQVQTKQKNSQAAIEKQQPTKQGLITITICFLPLEGIEHKAEEVEIEITVQKYLKKSFKFSLKGISLENRISQFQKALNAPLVRKKIQIDRFNFLQNLEKLCQYHFKSPLQIEFKNEKASDYGGPRREFYNKIGELIKDSKYGFFIKHPERDTYFFNDAFKQIAKVQQDNWAILFGKLIANSILNREIIGVKFCEQLWKILFEEKITFEDLEGILEKNTFQNYKLLLTYDEETIDSFGFNFTQIENNKDVELIPNGAKTLVNKDNINLYLEKLAEYNIINKYKKIIENFKKGFTKVIDIKIVKEWLSTNEMHTLTQGANEIKPNELLELTKYEGGEDQLISFYQTYVNDMDQNKIKQFLQFMTGSPFLPWNKQVQFIVEFTTSMKITSLPRTETCFYKLVVPHYKTFDVFQRKVDIALSYGLEGFGMA